LLRAAALLLLAVILVLVALRLAASLREHADQPPPGTVYVQTPTGRVAARGAGPVDGPPIVIVHGTAAWSGFWKDVSAHLASNGWRVVAIDLPPFGWSERDPHARYDRVSQAERLSAVLAAQKKPAIVIGHSFGAGSVVELALRHPAQIRGLVLVDAALGELDPKGEAPVASAFRVKPVAELTTSAMLTNPAALKPFLRSLLARKDQGMPWLETLRQPMRRTGTTSAYAAWLPNLFTKRDGALSRKSTNLKAIGVPVTLIWGRADTVTPLEQGQRIAAVTRARSLEVLPGVGHIPHIEDPTAFDAALDRALVHITEGEQ
jgi:pimeloyl-ACP methyl ester carboxylesterase